MIRFTISIVILSGWLALAPVVHAITAMQPFGGRIITAPTPGVTCPAGKIGSPFTIAPVGVVSANLFVGDLSPQSFGQLAPGVWTLGLYIPIPIPECVTQSVPPAPVTGFRTFLHGTSSPL